MNNENQIKTSFFQRIKGYFFTGLILSMPFFLTIFILVQTFIILDGIVGKYFKEVLGFPLPGAGIFSIIIIFILIGFVARQYFGRKVFEILEALLTRIPMVNKVYMAIRQISSAFFATKSSMFRKAVLVEYPRKGLYSIGFLTCEDNGRLESEVIKEDTVNLFVPTTPNPTSGMMIIAKKTEVIYLDISVAEGMKMVVSGGAVIPEEYIVNKKTYTEQVIEKDKLKLKRKFD